MPTSAIYTLSLHDALPISAARPGSALPRRADDRARPGRGPRGARHDRLADEGRQDGPADHPLHVRGRSEEHTSELQSLTNLVCRLLLEKKKTISGKTIKVI